MKHKTEIQGYSLKGLATMVATLRYDSLAEFLEYLVEEIALQSAGDLKNGRNSLGGVLSHARSSLDDCTAFIRMAWSISKPHMKE